MKNLKSWFANVKSKLTSFFKGATKELETVIIPAAIQVTTALKNIVDFDGLDVIGKIAGAGGPAVEDKIREVLPTVIADLQIAQAFLLSNPSTDDFINQIVKIGLSLKGDARTNFLIEFSGKLATAITDGKLTIQQGIVYTQELYAKLNEPKA